MEGKRTLKASRFTATKRLRQTAKGFPMGGGFDGCRGEDVGDDGRAVRAFTGTQRRPSGAVIPYGSPYGGFGYDTEENGPGDMSVAELVDHLDTTGEIPQRRFMKKNADHHRFYSFLMSLQTSNVPLEEPAGRRPRGRVAAGVVAGAPYNPLHRRDLPGAVIADLADPLPAGATTADPGTVIARVDGDKTGSHAEHRRDIAPHQRGLEKLKGKQEEQLKKEEAQLKVDTNELGDLMSRLDDLNEADDADRFAEVREAADRATHELGAQKKRVSDAAERLSLTRIAIGDARRAAFQPRVRTAAQHRDVAGRLIDLPTPARGGAGGAPPPRAFLSSPWIVLNSTIMTQLRVAWDFVDGLTAAVKPSTKRRVDLMIKPGLSTAFIRYVKALVSEDRTKTNVTNRFNDDMTRRQAERLDAEYALRDALRRNACVE